MITPDRDIFYGNPEDDEDYHDNLWDDDQDDDSEDWDDDLLSDWDNDEDDFDMAEDDINFYSYDGDLYGKKR